MHFKYPRSRISGWGVWPTMAVLARAMLRRRKHSLGARASGAYDGQVDRTSDRARSWRVEKRVVPSRSTIDRTPERRSGYGELTPCALSNHTSPGRRHTPAIHPELESRPALSGSQHHFFVVTQQWNMSALVPKQKELVDHAFAVHATVHVITECDDGIVWAADRLP